MISFYKIPVDSPGHGMFTVNPASVSGHIMSSATSLSHAKDPNMISPKYTVSAAMYA